MAALPLSKETTVLLVKKLPDLDPAAMTDLFRRFGASDVRPMSSKGRMRNSAFVSFPDREAASYALSRLLALDFRGRKLRVEFARPNNHALRAANTTSSAAKNAKPPPPPQQQQQQRRHIPARQPSFQVGDKQAGHSNPKQTTTTTYPAQAAAGASHQRANPVPIAPRVGIDYPPPPTLYYDYPAPTTSILTNIGHAIAAVPKLYVQVLHLMNKMNLPPPFDAPTPAAAIVRVSSRYGKRRRDELLSSEESEWESGDEAANLRPKLATGANYLTAPLGLKSAPQRDPCVKTAGAVSTPKKRQKKEGRERVDAATQTEAGQMAGVGEPIGTPANGETKGKRPERTGIPPLPSSAEKPAQGKEADGSQSRRSLPQSAQVARLGLQPQSTSAAQLQPREQLDVQPPRSDEEYAFDPEFTKECITLAELEVHRMSPAEMEGTAAYKNYAPGEPSRTLYVKNLAPKHVSVADLERIFGRHFRSREHMKSEMEIKLMREGRLKGQAFVKFSRMDTAAKAMREVHGYVLHGRPMVVQYGRKS